MDKYFLSRGYQIDEIGSSIVYHRNGRTDIEIDLEARIIYILNDIPMPLDVLKLIVKKMEAFPWKTN